MIVTTIWTTGLIALKALQLTPAGVNDRQLPQFHWSGAKICGTICLSDFLLTKTLPETTEMREWKTGISVVYFLLSLRYKMRGTYD